MRYYDLKLGSLMVNRGFLNRVSYLPSISKLLTLSGIPNFEEILILTKGLS